MPRKKKAGRRPNNTGSLTVRKSDGRVMCRFPSGERDAHGKPIPITEYFTGPSAEKDGNAWLDSMVVKRIQGQALRPDETTFGDLQKLWLQTFKSFVTGKKRSPTTYDKYYSLCENHLADYYEDTPAEVNEKSQTIITGLIEKNLAASTIIEIWQIAKQILEIALDRDILRKIFKVKLPKLESRIPRLYTDEQLITLMQFAERSQYGKALWLELGAGLRKSEILALEWSDIKTDRVVITKNLIRNGSKQEIKHQPKTPAGYREVFVDPFIMAKINSIPKTKSNIVFHSLADTHISLTNFSRQFRDWREKVDLEFEAKKKKDPAFTYTSMLDARFQDLRHNFISWMHSLGITLKVSMTQAGHDDVKTHIRRYAHASEDELKDAAQKVGAKLEQIFKDYKSPEKPKAKKKRYKPSATTNQEQSVSKLVSNA
jgi:integrase